MKLKFFLIVFSCLFSAHSEITMDEAPDFTITDVEGNEHHLYEYLDAGKYVLIDFWATW